MARYIDADEALRMMKNSRQDCPYTATKKLIWNLAHDSCTSCIMATETADVVEVKHGKWIPVTYTYFGLKRYECSECKNDEYWQKRYLEHKEKFCPNCGADMRGDTDGKM